MKNLFILSFLLLFSSFLFAQETVNIAGKIVSHEGTPIEFATISIQSLKDSTIITGTTTDSLGVFTIPLEKKKTSEALLVEISFLGFQSVSKKLTNQFNLGIIKLQVKNNLINAVEVVSKRPELIRKADKIIMSLEKNSLFRGTNVIEALKYAPGIIIDGRDNILLNGKLATKFLINGQEILLEGEQLKNKLQSIYAIGIKSIELISNPSAKYDAEGVSGVINIITKQSAVNGINGSFFGNFAQGKFANTKFGTNFNVKKDNLSFFMNYGFTSKVFFSEIKELRRFKQSNFTDEIYDEQSEEQTRSNFHTISGGVDWQINDKHELGLQVNGLVLDYKGDYQSNTNFYNSSTSTVIDSSFTNNSNSNGPYDSFNSSINYTFKMDESGKKFSFITSYAKIVEGNNSFYEVDFFNSQGLHSKFPNPIDILDDSSLKVFSSKFDFTIPIKKNIEFELGSKYSFIERNSHLNFFDRINEEFIFNRARSSEFTYAEQIQAAYVTMSLTTPKDWNINLGLREELTFAEGNISTNQLKVLDKTFINFFPSLFIQKSLKGKSKYINFNYGRRIERPGFKNLNSIVNFSGPFISIIGNPNLQPEIINSFELSYGISSLNFTLNYSRNKNVISEFSTQDDETKQIIIAPQNLDEQNYLSFSLYTPITIQKWWNASLSTMYYYNQYKSEFEGGNLDNSAHSVYVSLNNGFTLPKDYQANLFLFYISPFSNGVQSFSGYHTIDVSLAKTFKNWSVSLKLSDILRSQKDNVELIFLNQNALTRQRYDSRKISLNINYNFARGKKHQRAYKDYGNEDEINRSY